MAFALPSFILRQAGPKDHRQILRLARELDSTNLPTDSLEVAEVLKCSAKSFACEIAKREHSIYVFCAEEIGRRRIVAASMIIGKHGTPSSPHYYFEMDADERYSHTLRRMFRHPYLRLRYSMDGPSEIGGLIVSAATRGHPERIGKQISWVRFLYIARHFSYNSSRKCFHPASPDTEIAFGITMDGSSPGSRIARQTAYQRMTKSSFARSFRTRRCTHSCFRSRSAAHSA